MHCNGSAVRRLASSKVNEIRSTSENDWLVAVGIGSELLQDIFQKTNERRVMIAKNE